jgi:hypothetical protein
MNWHTYHIWWTAVRTVYIVLVSDTLFYFIQNIKYPKEENVLSIQGNGEL